MWIPLHVHSEFSALDGAIRIKDYVKWAQDYGVPAIAVTDHGNMSHVPALDEKKQDIKPIYGMEAYCEPIALRDDKHYHLVILAKNKKGFSHLCRIASKSYRNFTDKKPTIRKEDLESDDLIILSACMQGELANIVKAKDEEALKRYLDFFRGKSFFMELIDISDPEQDEINGRIIEIAEKYGIPAVITPDAHYFPEDKEWYPALVASNWKTTVDNVLEKYNMAEQDLSLPDPHTIQEKWESIYPEGITNTLVVADMVESFGIKEEDYRMPKLKAKADLRKIAEDAALAKISKYRLSKKDYINRLNSELDVIYSQGFADYMLLVYDIVKSAKEKGIYVGPGRGSAAGSLVAWALDITAVDPIKNGLLFERFINPERVSLPDIDIDIEDERRDEVIEEIKQKYGAESVAGIANFSKYEYKQAVRDALRVYGVHMGIGSVGDAFAKLAGKIYEENEEQTEEEIARKTLEKNTFIPQETAEKALFAANRIKGLIRHYGRHAAGIVVTPGNIEDFCPTMTIGKEYITQYDMHGLDHVKLVKMDILGLSTLYTVKDAYKTAKEYDLNVESPSDIYEFLNGYRELPREKADRTYGLMAEDPDSCFQLSSPGMKKLLRQIKPKDTEALSAILALYRPGPINSGMVDAYVNRESFFHGRVADKIKDILSPTNGVLIYQEQVMKIAEKIAGYTPGQADILRRAIGKKEKEDMEAERASFVLHAVKNGYDEKEANIVFDAIEKFAGYGFNKSHSMSYSYLAFVTAWYKANYGPAWTKANLKTKIKRERREDVGLYIEDAMRFCNVYPAKVIASDKTIGDALDIRLVRQSGINVSNMESFWCRNSWALMLGIRDITGIKDKIAGYADMPIPKDMKELLSLCVKYKVPKSIFVPLFATGFFDMVLEKYHESPVLLRSILLDDFNVNGLIMEKTKEIVTKIMPRGKKDPMERLTGHALFLSLLLFVIEKGKTDDDIVSAMEDVIALFAKADTGQFNTDTNFRLKTLLSIYEIEKQFFGEGITIKWWNMAAESVLYRFFGFADETDVIRKFMSQKRNYEDVKEVISKEGVWLIGKVGNVFFRNGKPITVISGKYPNYKAPLFVNHKIEDRGCVAVKVKFENNFFNYVDHKPIVLGQVNELDSRFVYMDQKAPENVRKYIETISPKDPFRYRKV